MNRDYSHVMESLETIRPNILQVVIYYTFEPRLAIVLDKEPLHLLDGLQDLRNFVVKHRMAFPLVVTRNFVEKSLDVFPLEFLDIVSSDIHNIFSAEDVFAKLSFSKADILMQMERELKSKWLLTRQAVLEESPKPRLLAEKLRAAIHAITPVLKGFCFCADTPIPKAFPELLAQVSSITGMDLKVMDQWVKMDTAELFHIKSYLEILANLINHMESNE